MAPTKAKATPERIAQGKRILEAVNTWKREGQHRTVKELLGIIGVSEPTYYNWIGGTVDNIAAVNLLKLCRETRFRAAYIIWGQKPKRTLDNHVVEDLLRELEAYTPDQWEQLLTYAKFIKSSPPPK